MSWEVWTMKSKVSFFDGGISRNLLRRCWPLWAGYFLLLLFLLPVPLGRVTAKMAEAGEYRRLVLSFANDLVPVSFAVGILAVMVVFSYLYSSRSCGLMNSLPIRRETMFCTVWLTGLMPLLLAEVLAALLTAALYLGRGLDVQALLLWLLVGVCAMLCFYGIASFCAMLTGSLLVLPGLYLVLNLTAWVVEDCLQSLLRSLIYGLGNRGGWQLIALSPPMWLTKKLYVARRDMDNWELLGLGWLPIYALAGLALAGLALLLYRKRRMETAGDTVAWPVLKPVFRYCMAFGTALVAAVAVNSLVLGGSFHGRGAAVLIWALLLGGAALGWMAAEMLIQRTVRIFPGKWKGLIAVCAVLTLGLWTVELDLTGFERRVPEADEVERVTLLYRGTQEIEIPENIEKALELHRSMVANKALHEPEIHSAGDWMTLHYRLKDGRELERSWYLQMFDPEDPGDLMRWEELLNCDELLDWRNAQVPAATVENIYAASLYYTWTDEQGRESGDELRLTPEEAADFYQNAILPDQRQHSIGRIWLLNDEEHRQLRSNVHFGLDLRLTEEEAKAYGWQMYYYNGEVCMDSESCLAWIREHTQIPVMPQSEAEPFEGNGTVPEVALDEAAWPDGNG